MQRISHDAFFKGMHRDRAASFIPHEHDPFVGELVCILARRLTAYFCIIWVERPYWNVVFSLHGTRTWLELGSFVIGKSCIGDISHPGKENYHIMKLLAWNTLAHCILWDCSESKCWFKSGSGIAKRTAMLSSFQFLFFFWTKGRQIERVMHI